MCQALSTKEVTSSANPAETTNFRKLLLTCCQKEFEKDGAGIIEVANKKKEIESAESVGYVQSILVAFSGVLIPYLCFQERKRKELEEELEELVNINRRLSLGNIR